MSMSDAEREVLEQIKRIGIISIETADRVSREFPSSDDSTSGSGRAAPATRVARVLEAGKLITPHQAKAIAGGNAEELSYGGQYIREDLLGQGGMGSVYRARHRMMDRVVALKTIRFEQFENADARGRFVREVRASGRILHSNLVVAFDAGERNNELYLVMEFIEGTNLHELVRELYHPRQTVAGLSWRETPGKIEKISRPREFFSLYESPS